LLKADPLLAAVCALLTGLAAMLGANAPEQQRTATIVIPAALTLIVLWRMSAGVTIYTFSSSLVGLLQSVMVRRRMKTMAA
jgi:membrane protein insertase Oxa1/YidC/SpoIIIJ